MGTLLSIDPGKHEIGYSYFTKKILVFCGLLPTKNKKLKSLECIKIAGKYLNPKNIIIEKPQVYQQEKQKGDPNDLIDLARVIGKIEYILRESKIELCLPKTWKGQVPKKIMNNRIIEKLHPPEKKILSKVKIPDSKKHNVIDAIGIGLWYLERL